VTIRERLEAWWRGEGVGPERPLPAATPARPQHVLPEYRPLYVYLEHRYASTVVLTFEQMESLTGHLLPEAARTERGWWTSAGQPASQQSKAWTLAGRTAVPNLQARTVTFERQP
jgi:hypothetical protein